jgi:hypothetical protein
VEHRASIKSFQTLRSPAVPLTSFYDLPVFLISSSIVLRHVLFGLPLLLYPWGFQSNAVFSITPASLRNVCPIKFHFLPLIWISIGFYLVILHSSSFVILSVHYIFNIRVKHLFIYVYNLLVIWLVVFQVSQAYNNTDFTFVLNIRSLFIQIRTAALRLIVRSWLEVPTFATSRLHACHHARAPSGRRWNCGRKMSGNFAYIPIYMLHLGFFYMP